MLGYTMMTLGFSGTFLGQSRLASEAPAGAWSKRGLFSGLTEEVLTTGFVQPPTMIIVCIMLIGAQLRALPAIQQPHYWTVVTNPA